MSGNGSLKIGVDFAPSTQWEGDEVTDRSYVTSYVATSVAVAVVPVTQFLMYWPLGRVVNCFPEVAFTRTLAQWALVLFAISTCAWIVAHVLRDESPHTQPIHGGKWFFVAWIVTCIFPAAGLALGMTEANPVLIAECGRTYPGALAHCSVLIAPSGMAFLVSLIFRSRRTRLFIRAAISAAVLGVALGVTAWGLGIRTW